MDDPGELGRKLREQWERTATQPVVGRVTGVRAGGVRARIPDAEIGACYAVERREGELIAELTEFDDEEAFLTPLDVLDGVVPGASVVRTPLGALAPDAEAVLGQVIDPLGVSLADGTAFPCTGRALRSAAPNPLERQSIETQLPTGVRAVDALLPLGVGQRVGLFAGSGVGKSTLLGQLARGARADVCIVGLIGERGREVAEFLDSALDDETRARTTVVVATSDAPPLLRVRAAEMATALAEDWRSRGRHCLLLVDSLTRYARGLRETALASGERAVRRGYPARVFSELPRLLERAGTSRHGAITAVYTVLVEGDDMEEPVSDEVRGLVDGHWVLSRRLAERGHFPAIDVLASVSRVAGRIVDGEHQSEALAVRRVLSTLAEHGDAIDLGIYEPGSRAEVDLAIELRDDVRRFLVQDTELEAELDETRRALVDLADMAAG